MSAENSSVDSEPAASGREAGSRESCIPHFDALWFCYSTFYARITIFQGLHVIFQPKI